MVQVFIAILSSTWGRRIAYVLGSVGMLALGVAIGRFAIPKVVTVTKVEVREVTKIVKVKAKDIVRTTKTVTEPTPAGPKTTTTTETHSVEHVDTNVATATETVGAKVVTSGGSRADWRVSALGGMLLLPRSGALPETSWLVGAGAERRIAGPIYGGVFALGGPKAGVIGITLSGEF